MRRLQDPVVRRRRWWLTPGVVALLVVVLLAVALLGALRPKNRLSPDSETTFWVSLLPDVVPISAAAARVPTVW